jgi:hypothetical protein
LTKCSKYIIENTDELKIANRARPFDKEGYENLAIKNGNAMISLNTKN